LIDPCGRLQTRRAVEKHVVVAADDLPEARECDRLVGLHDGERLERRAVLARDVKTMLTKRYRRELENVERP
jgi:hypothetical protein